MKEFKKNTTKLSIIVLMLFLTTSFCASAQNENRTKNSISIGGGLSLPNFTSDSGSDNYGSSGFDYYVNYDRTIYSAKKGYLSLDAKYLTISNPYALLDSDVKSINSGSNTSIGVWSGTCDNFKLTSYLLGASWSQYLSKNEKFIGFIKFYAGSSSLVSPEETFNSNKGYFIKANESTANSFTYSTCGGFSYGLSKNIYLGINVDYIKSSFLFDNQTITYSGGGSQIKTPYTINYSNLTLNTELSFRF